MDMDMLKFTDESPFPSDEHFYLLINEEEIQELIKQKEAEGFTVYRREPKQLFFDLDSEEALRVFKDSFDLLQDNLDATIEASWRSKSKGYHVIVNIDQEINGTQALAMQASCGSDRKREFLGVLMTINGIDNPILLFRPKGSVDLVL